jgi:hypothetical protein
MTLDKEATTLLQELADGCEHLIDILEGKAEQEWSYEYLRAWITRAREVIPPPGSGST